MFTNFKLLIINDLLPRKQEFRFFLRILDNIELENEKQITIKYGIVALYSHWEGYIKKISNEYLRILYSNISIAELSDSLLINKISILDNIVTHPKYQHELVSLLKNKLKYKEINVSSNLNYTQLSKIIKIFGFNIDVFLILVKNKIIEKYRLSPDTDLYKSIKDGYNIFLLSDSHVWNECNSFKEEMIEILKFILDFNLLKYRNQIAHGEVVSSFPPEYISELYEFWDILLQSFQEVIIGDIEKYSNSEN